MGHGWYRKKTIQFRGQLLIIVLIGSWNENYTPQEQSSISREYFARYGGTFIIDNQPSGRNRTVVNSGQTQENKTRINRAKEERWVWFDNGFGLHLQLLLLLLPCTIVCYERCRQKNLTRTPPNHHLIYPSSSVRSNARSIRQHPTIDLILSHKLPLRFHRLRVSVPFRSSILGSSHSHPPASSLLQLDSITGSSENIKWWQCLCPLHSFSPHNPIVLRGRRDVNK